MLAMAKFSVVPWLPSVVSPWRYQKPRLSPGAGTVRGEKKKGSVVGESARKLLQVTRPSDSWSGANNRLLAPPRTCNPRQNRNFAGSQMSHGAQISGQKWAKPEHRVPGSARSNSGSTSAKKAGVRPPLQVGGGRIDSPRQNMSKSPNTPSCDYIRPRRFVRINLLYFLM